MDEPILRAENLKFEYDADGGPVEVFRDLDITVRRGEILAILGHNGCGKSTLAKHFNGVLLPSGGKVYVAGMDTADEEKLLDIRRTVGMVFQNPDNQIVASVVEEDVAFAPENLGVPPEEIRRRVDESLATVGMTEYARHAPHKLSGGQKQRIAIAGVLAMHPQCIVLDEPTAMLDPVGRREVMRTILELNKNDGTTIVLITHHMEEAAQCDRVAVMETGDIIAQGTPAEVFTQMELLRRVGLEVPQTVELLYELRRAGIQVPLDALGVEECAAAIAAAIK